MLLNYGVGEDSWESLGCKEIQSVHPKGNQSCIFIGRTDVEAETPILWPPDEKNRLTGKDPDAGKDRRQEKKGTTEDEMVGWHHWLDGHEFEQAFGVLQFMGSQRVEHDWATELNWWMEALNNNGSLNVFDKQKEIHQGFLTKIFLLCPSPVHLSQECYLNINVKYFKNVSLSIPSALEHF